jgi:hypothetical protein
VQVQVRAQAAVRAAQGTQLPRSYSPFRQALHVSRAFHFHPVASQLRTDFYRYSTPLVHLQCLAALLGRGRRLSHTNFDTRHCCEPELRPLAVT